MYLYMYIIVYRYTFKKIYIYIYINIYLYIYIYVCMYVYMYQRDGVGIPRTAYLIPGCGGVCGVVGVGMFVVVSVSVLIAPPAWVAAGGGATHPRPILGPMGPMGSIPIDFE